MKSNSSSYRRNHLVRRGARLWRHDGGTRIDSQARGYQEPPRRSRPPGNGSFEAHIDEGTGTCHRAELSYSELEGPCSRPHIHLGPRAVNWRHQRLPVHQSRQRPAGRSRLAALTRHVRDRQRPMATISGTFTAKTSSAPARQRHRCRANSTSCCAPFAPGRHTRMSIPTLRPERRNPCPDPSRPRAAAAATERSRAAYRPARAITSITSPGPRFFRRGGRRPRRW